MSKWLVRLSGDSYVLDTLVRQQKQDNLRVVKEDGYYFLTSSTFDVDDTAEQVDERAEQLLRQLRGILRLELNHAPKIHTNAQCRVHEDGRREWFVLAAAHGQLHVVTLEATATIVSATGEIVPSSQPSLTYYERLNDLAAQDEVVRDALGFFGADGPRAFNLYKVFELIRDDVGGEAKIEKNGWATLNDMERFRVSMNKPHILREDARHASKKQPPPKRLKPMRMQEAESLIFKLFHDWLPTKANS